MSTVLIETEPDAEAEPSESEAPSSRERAGLGRAALVMGLVGLVFSAVILAVANGDDRSTPDPVEYVVGPDVGAEIASGETDDLLPEIIRLTPGQDLVLRNNDWRPHAIGDLAAERGQTARQTFASEGRYVTATSLRSDGRVTILVESTDG